MNVFRRSTKASKKAVGAGAMYVWFVDLDTHWCKNVKEACSQLPAAAFEHVVGTIQCPRSDPAGTVRAIEKGMTAFLRASFDYQSAATPIRMIARSPLLPVLLQGIEAMMTTCSCKGDYRAFMVLLEQKVFTCGLLGAYRELAAFCGVPYWTKRACLTQAAINVNLFNCGGSEKLSPQMTFFRMQLQ